METKENETINIMKTKQINDATWGATDHANIYYNAGNDRYAYIVGEEILEVGYLDDCLDAKPLLKAARLRELNA